MSEVLYPEFPEKVEGLTGRPRKILDRYIHHIPILHRLITSPKMSNVLAAEAVQEIEVLNTSDTKDLLAGIFSIIGSENPPEEADHEEQNRREGALELLQLVDFKKVHPKVLLDMYLSRVRNVPSYAEAYGSIYALLEAGQEIAPHLPNRKVSTRLLIDVWNTVIAVCLMNQPLQSRHDVYTDLRVGKLNSIIENLPLSAAPETTAEKIESLPQIPEKPQSKVLPKTEKPAKTSGEDSSLKVFRRIERGVENIEFTPEELPWLKENIAVLLDHIILRDGGTEFYLGFCLAGGTPSDAAESMGKHYRRLALNSFYTILPEYITRHTSGGVKMLSNARTSGRIHYASNPGGQRLYFIETDRINNQPVIIVIGMCDKAQQVALLRAFTNMSIKDIKKFGKI